jgi:hypothetical protein
LIQEQEAAEHKRASLRACHAEHQHPDDADDHRAPLIKEVKPREKQRLGRQSHKVSEVARPNEEYSLTWADLWAELWPELQKHGWKYRAGEGLVSWVWMRPGVMGKLSQLGLGVDYFESEQDVMSYLQQQRRCVDEVVVRGSSCASWHTLWQILQHEGWTYRSGTGLVTWRYLVPGVEGRLVDMEKGVDYFESEAEVAAFLAGMGDLAAVAEHGSCGYEETRDDDGSEGSDIEASEPEAGLQAAGDMEVELEQTDTTSTKAGRGAQPKSTPCAAANDEDDGSGEEAVEEETSEVASPIEEDSLTWAELWPELKKHGWKYRAGEGLVSWVWMRPGVKGKLSQLGLGVDYFESEQDVMSYLQQQRHRIKCNR